MYRLFRRYISKIIFYNINKIYGSNYKCLIKLKWINHGHLDNKFI